MNRGLQTPGTTFLYTGGEPGSGMDCLQLRQAPAPFHYLISEQAKSLVALQELQNEVGALLEFRDVVIETFPSLRTKLASPSPSTMTSSHSASNIPVSVKRSDWEPGVRVRRKLGNKEEAGTRSSGSKRESAVQDSGFSTETSSKETHSASSSAPSASAPHGAVDVDEAEDELLNLLEVIHRKGTRLKNEVEALRGVLTEQQHQHDDDHHLHHHQLHSEEADFQRVLFTASADDVRQLRQERDMLLDRLAEMEAEVLAGRVHTSRLQEDLEHLLAAKQDLEEQLRSVVVQRGEVNSKIRDLHSQFVTKGGDSVGEVDGGTGTSSQCGKAGGLDVVFGRKLHKTKVPDKKKVAAILEEHDPVVLQRHLLNTMVHNQVLQEKLDTVTKLEVGLVDKLDKAREENEDLQFQLEDKNIELEGTRARIRVLEQLQKPSASPDVVPASATDHHHHHHHHRTEITTASMKAMSPLPMNLQQQQDHTSSTESAHDQAEAARKATEATRRRPPSKIPLVKSIPVGGKRSPAPGAARSRSGDSPGRPHSAQSWRNAGSGAASSSLPKSRNGSLVSGRDSLTGKLRSGDSMPRLRDSPGNSVGSGGRSASRKSSIGKDAAGSGGIRRTNSIRESPEAKVASDYIKRKYPYPWTLSLYNSNANSRQQLFCPDSLDKNDDEDTDGGGTPVTENSHRFQTANTFLWDTPNRYYDSIDTNNTSGLYQPNGEELAECDSLEKQLVSGEEK